ncbi:hypothetical protein HN51_008541, partial [Arachis hypogaea]
NGAFRGVKWARRDFIIGGLNKTTFFIGRDLAREGNEIIREASKWSPELAAACEVWKAIKFEFPAMDTL